MASDESYLQTLPIVSLLKDVDAYAGRVFDIAAKTVNDLQTVEQLKSSRGEIADWKKLEDREVILAGLLRGIKNIQENLTEMRRADWVSLSLVWGNGIGRSLCNVLANGMLIYSSELVGQALEDAIATLVGIECKVMGLRENFDGKGQDSTTQAPSEEADELLALYQAMIRAGTSYRAIRHRRDIHPCRGGLQLIKGDDRGGIDRPSKKDLTNAELERLHRGGMRGTYLFWKCDSCDFRIKYFVSESRAASLLTNDDHLTFKDSSVRCSRAFIAMSHLEQIDSKRLSGSYASSKYTCIICTFHRPAARHGRTHTFSNRDDYARHVDDTHTDFMENSPPAFVMQKLRIEHPNRLSDGRRAELWTA